MMLQVQKRLSYSLVIGLALFVVSLVYLPQWRHYAPNVHQSAPTTPYLTPWTVISVGVLGLALALIAAPFRTQHPVQIILSKTLSVLVVCFAAVFLLEYASGIRVPDLDIFFLPDSSGQRVTLYAARPTPHSAATSFFFASALLLFHPGLSWRKKAFQIALLAAFATPTLACVSYLIEFLFPPSHPPVSRIGLSFPAVVLYFTLGSAVLGLALASKMPKPKEVVSGRLSVVSRDSSKSMRKN
jgi:hypothetical protein